MCYYQKTWCLHLNYIWEGFFLFLRLSFPNTSLPVIGIGFPHPMSVSPYPQAFGCRRRRSRLQRAIWDVRWLGCQQVNGLTPHPTSLQPFWASFSVSPPFQRFMLCFCCNQGKTGAAVHSFFLLLLSGYLLWCSFWYIFLQDLYILIKIEYFFGNMKLK